MLDVPKRFLLPCALMLAASFALSVAGVAAVKGDSIKGKGTLSNGSTFSVSAAGTPSAASGTLTTTDPGGVTTTEPVSCLNVTDAGHAYVGTPTNQADLFAVVAFTIGKPDTFTLYVVGSATACADPASLGNVLRFPSNITKGHVSITDG